MMHDFERFIFKYWKNIPPNHISSIYVQSQNLFAQENGSEFGLSYMKLLCDLELEKVTITSDYG